MLSRYPLVSHISMQLYYHFTNFSYGFWFQSLHDYTHYSGSVFILHGITFSTETAVAEAVCDTLTEHYDLKLSW